MYEELWTFLSRSKCLRGCNKTVLPVRYKRKAEDIWRSEPNSRAWSKSSVHPSLRYVETLHTHNNLFSWSGPGSSVGIATDYGLDGPGIVIPVGTRFSEPVQTGPGAHPASCKIGTWSFPGVKSGRRVRLTPHPLLVPRSIKSRAITLLLLWAVRPVQSLSAGTKVHFNLYFSSSK